MEWRVTNQSQTDHLGDYFSLNTAIRYEGGEFEVRQRILDNKHGYQEGKRRIALIATAPELLDIARNGNELVTMILEYALDERKNPPHYAWRAILAKARELYLIQECCIPKADGQ